MGYTDAFKFSGRITEATSGTNSLYGSQTAPGFSQADITNGTVATMFIYYKGEGSSFTFIRTAFTKTPGTVPDVIKTGTNANDPPRTFTKS